MLINIVSSRDKWIMSFWLCDWSYLLVLKETHWLLDWLYKSHVGFWVGYTIFHNGCIVGYALLAVLLGVRIHIGHVDGCSYWPCVGQGQNWP